MHDTFESLSGLPDSEDNQIQFDDYTSNLSNVSYKRVVAEGQTSTCGDSDQNQVPTPMSKSMGSSHEADQFDSAWHAGFESLVNLSQDVLPYSCRSRFFVMLVVQRRMCLNTLTNAILNAHICLGKL